MGKNTRAVARKAAIKTSIFLGPILFALHAGLVGIAVAGTGSSTANSSTSSLASSTSVDFADDFRGHISYQGTYSGKVSEPIDIPTDLSLNSLWKTAKSAQGKEIGGTFQVEMEVNSAAVTVTYNTTGWLRGDTISGTRTGDTCKFLDDNSTWTGHCGPDGFRGTNKSFSGEDPQVKLDFDAAPTRVVDYAVEEKKQAEAAAAARVEAEKQRVALDAKEAALTGLAKQLNGIIKQDSQSWLMWVYDRASVNNVKIIEKSKDGKRVVLYGEYTYNGGSAGWVKVALDNNTVYCLQFWNESACRPLGQPPSHGILGNILGGMMGGGSGSSGSSSDGCDAQCQENRDAQSQIDQNNRENEQRNNTPLPPPPPPPNELGW